MNKSDFLFSICIGVFAAILVHLIAPPASPYDYYTRLSQAFISGNICLLENPPWLNELIPIKPLGYCVVYPIAPAIVLMPFVFVSSTFTQSTGAHIIFGCTAAIVYLLFRKKLRSRIESLFFSVAWSFGTIFFPMSAVGSSWYIAQTIGSCFALLSLLVFEERKRSTYILSGFLLSVAAISRLPLHLFIFYFIFEILVLHKTKLKEILIATTLIGLGFLPLFSVQRIYNFARYGTMSDQGYYLIPGKFEEEDFKNGQFNLKNIPKHLEVFLFKLPKSSDSFPYIVPSHHGLSILITSPFLILALWSLIKKKKWSVLTTILIILILEMSHGTVGFSQFGYRFALDVYPLLFLGFTFEKHNRRYWILISILVAFSILVNIWGVFAFVHNWFIW